jgi:hypothetical protein
MMGEFCRQIGISAQCDQRIQLSIVFHVSQAVYMYVCMYVHGLHATQLPVQVQRYGQRQLVSQFPLFLLCMRMCVLRPGTVRFPVSSKLAFGLAELRGLGTALDVL